MDMIDRVIAREGGAKVTNYSQDPGGITKYGISQRAHPEVDVKNLSYSQARKIYEKEYLINTRIDELPAPDFFKEAVLDFAVHSGPSTAIKYVQKLVNVEQDGKLGPETFTALQGFDLKDVQKALAVQRALFLARQVVAKPSKLIFLIGWLNRALSFL